MGTRMNVGGVDKGVMSCAAKPVTKCFVVLVSNETLVMKYVIRLLKVKIGSVFSAISSPYTTCVYSIKL